MIIGMESYWAVVGLYVLIQSVFDALYHIICR